MPESYKKVRLITAANGLTSNGSYLGFINGQTAQMVGIHGPLVIGSNGLQSNLNGVTYFGSTYGNLVKISAAPGAVVPVHCQNIMPQTYDVLGLVL